MKKSHMTRRCHRLGAAAGCLLLLCLGTKAPAETIFSHSSFDDFRAGTPGQAGQNLHVSRDGTIQFINWFDLDFDGHPDIVINNDHNPYENVDAMIYHNRAERGLRSLLPPIPEDTPPFQLQKWQQKSLETIDFLPTIGGGNALVVDLNGNGHKDIVFSNFIHGWAKRHFPVFIYWGGPDGYDPARRSELPSLEARGLAAADLSGNGRLDLVLANYGMEYHASEDFHGDQYESWIYWQDERGFSEDNRSTLPTAYAVDVEAADLTGDGRNELIVLNAQPESTIRIFRQQDNSREYDQQPWAELPVHNAEFVRGLNNRLLVADLNNTGRPDIFASSRGPRSQIFWNDDGFHPDMQTDLPTMDAIAAKAVDLNENGWKDLVIANNRHEYEEDEHTYEIDSYIYWGGQDGFSETRRQALPTLGAAGVAVGDVTGDGFNDIVFANYQNETSYDVPSYIYTGSEQGYNAAARQDLHAFGPVDVQLADISRNGRLDVFLMSRHSGTSYARDIVPSYVYWGNERGQYSPAAMSRLPIKSGYSSNAADLSGNGHADLVFTTYGSVSILYGQNGTYPEEDMRLIDMPFRGMSTNIADFNRNGHLDILVGGLHGDGPDMAILYGSETGFNRPTFFNVDMGIIASAVADISGDGQLEIILGGRGDIQIIPLTDEGEPDTENAYRLEVDRQSQRFAVADLNGNGRLDLIASHYRDNSTKRLNVKSAIYWNEAGRLSAENRSDLQTWGGHWVSAADVFDTGQLDLIFSNYHGERQRDLDVFIYSPDDDGVYGDRRTTLPAASSSAHLVMDFTGNGHNDLLVVNHTAPSQHVGLWPISGVHGHGSYLYEGSADGFDPQRKQVLPSFGPHKIINAEPGDIARRRPYETYTSPTIERTIEPGTYVIEIEGRFNHRTSVELRYRASEGDSWQAGSLIETQGQTRRFAIDLAEAAPTFSYQLRLHSGGSGTGPIINAVRMRAR